MKQPMPDANKNKPPAGTTSAAGRPQKLPDPATCRVQRTGFGENLECLSIWKFHCPYAIPFGSTRFCSSPDRAQILAYRE
jgi:hypothetical protein